MSHPYNLILAMREPYLTQLLNGEKTAEVRRTKPDLINIYGCRLYLYHKKRIYGHVTVKNWQHTAYQFLTPLCKEWSAAAALTPDEMKKYLSGGLSKAGMEMACRNGIIYLVGEPVRYAFPVDVPCRPQSWQYMTPEIKALLPYEEEVES